MIHRNFAASWALKACFVLVVVSVPITGWFFYVQHEPVWVQVAVWSPLPVLFKTWPRAIRGDDEGVSQRTLFGRLKRIRFADIEDISYLVGEGTVFLYGAGNQIEHGRSHSYQAEFAELLSERSGKNIDIGCWESEEQYDQFMRNKQED